MPQKDFWVPKSFQLYDSYLKTRITEDVRFLHMNR